jgi:hypothetical protein
MHRSLEVARRHQDGAAEQALTKFERMAGLGRASGEPEPVIQAAFAGRVSQLLLAPGVEQPGYFDTASQQVHMHLKATGDDEDLINAAAMETLAHGGEVHVIDAEKMPGNSPIAALYRW